MTSASRYNHRLRFEVLSRYSDDATPRCACCGEDHLEFLCLDHVDGDGASHRRVTGGAGKRTYLWVKKHGFPPGFRVLCANCNCSIGAFGYCPHTSSSQIQPKLTVSAAMRERILDAAHTLVADGVYPSLIALNRRLGKNAPAMILAHRRALVEEGRWPCEVAASGQKNMEVIPT